MEAQAIFYPVAFLILWTLAVLVVVGFRRLSAIRAGQVSISYYKLYRGGEEPPHLAAFARHYQNLLELPPLFYITALVAYVVGAADPVMVGLAWAFVGSRIIHSVVHLTINRISTRFLLFLSGAAILAAMLILILMRL